VFVTAVMFQQSRRLATIGGFSQNRAVTKQRHGDTHTDTQTDKSFFLIRPLKWAQMP
jgi:hypothetical protein